MRTWGRRGLGWTLVAAASLGFAWLVYRGFTWDLRSRVAEASESFNRVAVTRGDLRETVSANGTMESVRQVEIKSEVPGVVRVVHVEEGDRVQAGDPLVELDLDRLQDRVDEARAVLAMRSAEARQDLVGRAQADLALVRREHRRSTELFGKGVASESDRDDAAHRLRLAEISVADAEALAAAREAAVLQAKALLQKAERDLERGILRAPLDGVVTERPAEIGSPVADMSAANGGTLVAVVADDWNLRLVAEVDENDIARVRVGQAVDVTLDAFGDERFTGTVRKVAPAGTLSQKTASFSVEIGMRADERLRVGMSADARIVVGEHRDVVLIPNTAVIRGSGQIRVRRLVGDGEIDLVAIRELYSDGFQTIVADGVAPGDTVLVRRDGEG